MSRLSCFKLRGTLLRIERTNKYIPFPSENRVLARCMSRLISIVMAKPSCEAREEETRNEKILPTVGQNRTTSHLLVGRSNQLRHVSDLHSFQNNRRTGKHATKPRALGLLGHSDLVISVIRICPYLYRYTPKHFARL